MISLSIVDWINYEKRIFSFFVFINTRMMYRISYQAKMIDFCQILYKSENYSKFNFTVNIDNNQIQNFLKNRESKQFILTEFFKDVFQKLYTTIPD